jgi:hypothetical protein
MDAARPPADNDSPPADTAPCESRRGYAQACSVPGVDKTSSDIVPVAKENPGGTVPEDKTSGASMQVVQRASGVVASWFSQGRWLAAVIGLGGGILIGLLLFGEIWRLQPNWGDLPTWLLFFIGLVGGVTGLLQFRGFVRDQREEVDRNKKRDALMDKQLAEADRRADADLRRQAEDVEVRWVQRSTAGTGLITIGIVMNKSRRPISNITCRVMSKVDQKTIDVPDESAVMPEAQRDEFGGVLVGQKPLKELPLLGRGESCGFIFKGLEREPDQIVVAWFKDDAGNRWRLDETLHLALAEDGDAIEYMP